ncbi:uncharacterized protein EV422DRAFT_508743 [Fimicolochytrium jonesii]|uniref:uncharacterized protein n=1 Tax=Fimicolochytrium jonesii TaxID=1396493 RepID=UPI0022FEBA1B|nr:uncharacterized protein EV422DRAFT_508743 [Fimicolochytrium jonesii]KAI8817657.1 hypothetical protein EV422DRAFT_508743 [Fimicolochytrium jonesii]
MYHEAICERSLQEQRVQIDGFNIALMNLKGYSRSVCDAFDNFYSHAQKEMSKHATLLQSFPTDMQALHRIPIHESIAPEDQHLSDYVPEDKLITWAENCRVAHDLLVKKLSSATEIIKTVRSGTEAEINAALSIDLNRLENDMTEVQNARRRLETKHQRLERDISKVEEAIEEIRLSSSMARDRMTSLEHLHQIHRDEYLPNVSESDILIRNKTSNMLDSKRHLSETVLMRLQTISSIQSKIATVSPTISDLSNTLNSHTQAFAQLLHVHRMPAAWGATLAEIVRRREFVRVFISKAREMADCLGKFRIQEEKRRDTFRNEIVKYIPNGLIEGLDDRPPYCEVSLSNTKDKLPSVSREDLNDFEKLVSSIHATLVENEPVDPSASQTHSNHSISKLMATIVKMSTQVDATSSDFERILAKTGFSDRLAQLEEENSRLRTHLAHSQLGIRSTSLSRSPSSGPTVVAAYEQEITALRHRLLEADAKCIALERRSHEQEDTRKQLLQQNVKASQANDAESQNVLHTLEAERDKMKEQLDRAQADAAAALERQAAMRQELDKVLNRAYLYTSLSSKTYNFLDEVREGLNDCSAALHRPAVDASGEAVSLPVSPSGRATDDIRKGLRALQDDILCQAAELSNIREMIHEDEDRENSESLEGEIIALAAEVAELRTNSQMANAQLSMTREQLTSTEAREAVLEADVLSLRAIVKRAEEDFTTAKNSLRNMEVALEAKSRETDDVQAQFTMVRKEWSQGVRMLVTKLEKVRELLQEEGGGEEEESSYVMPDSPGAGLGIHGGEEEPSILSSPNSAVEELQSCVASVEELYIELREWMTARAPPATETTGTETTEVLTISTGLQTVDIETTDEESQSPEDGSRPSSPTAGRVELAKLFQVHSRRDSGVIVELSNRLSDLCRYYDELVSSISGESLQHQVVVQCEALSKSYQGLSLLLEKMDPSGMTAQEVQQAFDDAVGNVPSAIHLILDAESAKEKALERWKGVIGDELPALKASYQKSIAALADRISFRNFEINDLALFLPTKHPKAWAAFNVNAPHYFLAPEASGLFEDRIKSRDYILAYITGIQECMVNHRDPGSNPFGLASNSKFRFCLVRPYQKIEKRR